VTVDTPKEQQLLDAKDTIIEQQQEQNMLLCELAESRRLAFVAQCAELAELRRYHHVNNRRWGFFWFLVLGEVWPFKHIWKRG
jgi:hypothetical protein